MAHERDDRRNLTPPLRRDHFTVTDRYVYLNHAAVGVLPGPTRDALRAFVDAQAEGGVMGTAGYETQMPAYRERLGRFIGASGSEIAFLRNTGDGALAIAGGVDWRDGDEVLLCDNEFPSNVHPWFTVRDRGARVRLIPTAQQRLTPDVLRREIGSRTRLISVSWVSFADGYRHDLAALAEVAHAAGALFAVDAIQGLGVFPLDVRAAGVDALYGSGAKWMLALQGVGYLYVRAGLIDRLRLASPGWRSVADMWEFLNYDQRPVADATRFEGGTPNFMGALSVARSVEFLESAGPRAIAAHVLALTDRLCEGLQRLGAEIATPRGEGISSGIVTFTLPQVDSIELGKTLAREGIISTYRASGVRVSPHGYNTGDEIDRLLDVLATCKGGIPSLR